MRLTIAYSKIKKRNLVLINNATYQRETLSERPIRQPLIHTIILFYTETSLVFTFQFCQLIDHPYICIESPIAVCLLLSLGLSRFREVDTLGRFRKHVYAILHASYG